MLTTDPNTPQATLRERIEKDRASQPAHDQGNGSTRIAALISASKARLEKRD